MAGLSCATRVEWLGAMTPIEPIRFIPHASPTALLLQSGQLDNLVPAADAEELHAARRTPRRPAGMPRDTDSLNRPCSIGMTGCTNRSVSTPGRSRNR